MEATELMGIIDKKRELRWHSNKERKLERRRSVRKQSVLDGRNLTFMVFAPVETLQRVATVSDQEIVYHSFLIGFCP